MLNTSNGLLPAKKSRNSDDNMIPLINIVFLLLIFFMVAGQIRAMPDASLKLPKAELSKPKSSDTIRLEVSADGQMRLNGEAVDNSTLESWLQEQQDPHSLAIALFADQQTRAADLEPALTLLRQFAPGSLRLYAEMPADSDLPAATLPADSSATAEGVPHA